MKWHQWRLDDKGRHEAGEEPTFLSSCQLGLQEITDDKTVNATLCTVDLIERDDGDQHEEAADQGEEEKLECGLTAVGSTPDTDQEEHRDQRYFPEEIEKNQVVGEENAHQARLQQEQQSKETGDVTFNTPGEQNRRDLHERGQQHHQQGNAVQGQDIAGAVTLDPADIFVQQPATFTLPMADKEVEGHAEDPSEVASDRARQSAGRLLCIRQSSAPARGNTTSRLSQGN